ncbi:MAG: cob(I)yrinic acid a,c-diamide adenosyltransferase [Actinomycetota bacterium]
MTAAEPPRAAPPAAEQHVRSLVLVMTGDGKGKTTAAMCVVLRAVARGWRVAVVQFVKSGAWRSGEAAIARRLGVEFKTTGEGFTWDVDDLDASIDAARRAWAEAARTIAAGEHELVVLDEVTYPMTWGWIDTAEIVDAIRTRPATANIVLTGRDAPEEILDVADTVTEMVNRKHAFERGVAALRGIDF